MDLMLKLMGIVFLLVLAFGGGYYFRSQTQSCTAPAAAVVTVVPSNQAVTELPFPSPTPAVTSQPETELVFSNYNPSGVANNPSAPTVFTLASTRKIYLIQDYHWNGAKGKTPGTISLRSENNIVYGPWNAQGSPGQGGVPDAYWTVYPDVEIPAGTYTIVDSDPASWAQNVGTKGIGMSQVYAVK